jgi:electron transfer flavoprotein beta subunit
MSGPTGPAATPIAVGVALKPSGRIVIDPLTGATAPDPAPPQARAADLAALEVALRMRDVWGIAVTVVCTGPPSCEQLLREALAAGADQAIRIAAAERGDQNVTPPDAPIEPRGETSIPGSAGAITASAAALSTVMTDLPVVICGDYSADGGTGAVPALLAAAGRRSQALGLISVDVGPEPGVVSAQRRLDAGWRERLIVRAPMVLSVESGAARLRRASLPAVLAAREAQITVVAGSVSSPGAGRSPATLTASAGSLPGPLAERSRVTLTVSASSLLRPLAGRSRATLTVRPFRPRPRALPAPSGTTPRDRVLSVLGANADRDPPRLVEGTPAKAAAEIVDQLTRWGYL